MGNTILSLLVSLGLDSRDLDKGLTDAERKSLQSVTKIGQGMQKTGLMMTTALTLPIAASALKFVKSASDMAESVSKVNVVFGASAKGILDWSKTSATSMGMSAQKALEAAGTYGNLFQAMGLTVGPAEEMSKSVVQLAADLASFNNASPDEVLLALRSGLSGEMEPLKKFGVAMNEAALSSMAVTMGLGDNIQALSEAEKMQVRYAVIMGQTTMAQGDFARTAEGMANQSRIVKAKIEDLSASMGEKLLPVALKIVTWASDFIDKFGNMSSESQNFTIAIGGILVVSGPLLTFLGTILTVAPKVVTAFRAMWTAATGPVGLVVIGLSALAVGLKKGADAQGELNKAGGYWIDVGNRAAVTTGELTRAQMDVRDAAQAHAMAAVQVSESVGAMGEAVVTITEDLTDYGSMLSNVSSLGQFYTQNTKDIADAQAELATMYDASGNIIAGNEEKVAGLIGKIGELQTASDIQTAQWMTNLMTQQLGLDGISAADMAFLLEYQVSTGLMTTDAAIRAQGQWDAAMDMVEGYNNATGAVDDLRNAINNVPESKTSNIYTNHYNNEYWNNSEHGMAAGGFLPTGGWALVGDSASGMKTGYEELVHAVPGGVEVFPNGQGAIGGGTGGSSVAAEETVYMGPSADDIGRAVGDRLMQLGAI